MRHDPILGSDPSRVVASPVHTGPCVLARPGRDPQQCLRLPLPEARVVEESGGVYCPYCRLVAGVQPAVRLSFRVDLDESKDAPMVCRTCSMNFGHYLRPETLALDDLAAVVHLSPYHFAR